MATKLNQILAIEKTAKQDGERLLTGVHHTLQKPAMLSGISRSYKPKDDEGEQLPPESTRVQVTVERALTDVSVALTRMWDVAATKDFTNCRARADIVVDGNVLVDNVPVTHLLYLEKQLLSLLTFVRKLPVLDPSENWSRDEATDAWRTQATQTVRSKKVPRNHVKAPATDRHPAQVEMYFEDVLVGYWTTVKFSGAAPATRINQLGERIIKLAAAVKMAREHANSIEVEDVNVGQKIFGYLLR